MCLLMQDVRSCTFQARFAARPSIAYSRYAIRFKKLRVDGILHNRHALRRYFAAVLYPNRHEAAVPSTSDMHLEDTRFPSKITRLLSMGIRVSFGNDRIRLRQTRMSKLFKKWAKSRPPLIKINFESRGRIRVRCLGPWPMDTCY